MSEDSNSLGLPDDLLISQDTPVSPEARLAAQQRINAARNRNLIEVTEGPTEELLEKHAQRQKMVDNSLRKALDSTPDQSPKPGDVDYVSPDDLRKLREEQEEISRQRAG